MDKCPVWGFFHITKTRSTSPPVAVDCQYLGNVGEDFGHLGHMEGHEPMNKQATIGSPSLDDPSCTCPVELDHGHLHCGGARSSLLRDVAGLPQNPVVYLRGVEHPRTHTHIHAWCMYIYIHTYIYYYIQTHTHIYVYTFIYIYDIIYT